VNSLAAGHSTTSNKRAIGALVPLLLIGILLLATGLRFYKLDAQSFWNDEGNSARLSERSLPLILEGTASDIHPPLYYLILRGWRELVGDSEFGLRSFSAFAGILTVAATIAIGRRIFNSSVPIARATQGILIVALLAALNPTLVYYSQETRMYALLALLATLSTLALLGWLEASRRWPWASAYILLSTAGLYTHYFYPALFLFQGLIVLLWFFRKHITLVFSPYQLIADAHWARIPLIWLLMVAASALLYAPWIPIFFRQVGGRSAERAPIADFLWDSLRWMLFGVTVDEDDLVWVTAAAILLLLLAIVAAGRRVLIPFLGVTVLVISMYIAGATNPAFFKFLLTAVPFLIIWLGSAIGGVHRGYSDRSSLFPIAAIVLTIPILFGSIVSLSNLYNDPTFGRDDYRGIAAIIAADDHPSTGVILNAPNQWEVFTYYHREGAPVYPLPKGQPEPGILVPQLEEISNRHKRLYALYWGDDQQDPQHVVENWLDSNTFKASEQWIGDVRLVVYAFYPDHDREHKELNASFNEGIRLQSYALPQVTLKSGDVLPVTLYWTADELVQDRYKVFLHLVGQNGELMAQRDSEPVGGMFPTDTWQPGEIIADNQGVLLPQTLLPGDYTLLVGLYPLGEPQNRLEIDYNGSISDTLDLGMIAVD
jgi:uncharacterized membrane protein